MNNLTVQAAENDPRTASIAQWQSTGLVNQGSGVQSFLEAVFHAQFLRAATRRFVRGLSAHIVNCKDKCPNCARRRHMINGYSA